MTNKMNANEGIEVCIHNSSQRGYMYTIASNSAYMKWNQIQFGVSIIETYHKHSKVSEVVTCASDNAILGDAAGSTAFGSPVDKIKVPTDTH